MVEGQVVNKIELTEKTNITFYTLNIHLEMADIASKTVQLALGVLGDQLVASLLDNQTAQVENTLYTEFELPTKSKSLLYDALPVGGGSSTVIIQLTQPSFTGTWAELGNTSMKYILCSQIMGVQR